MFDFFTKVTNTNKTQKTKNQQKRSGVNFSSSVDNSLSGNSMQVFFPKSFDDVSKIIDVLSVGRPAIVNLKDVKENTAQRVLDILCGAIYALKGGMCEIEVNIYLFTPDGVCVNK